jgi:hypothetical protein
MAAYNQYVWDMVQAGYGGSPGPALNIYIHGFSTTSVVVASMRPTPTGVGVFPPDGQLQIGTVTKHLDETVARTYWATAYWGSHSNQTWGSFALDLIEEAL